MKNKKYCLTVFIVFNQILFYNILKNLKAIFFFVFHVIEASNGKKMIFLIQIGHHHSHQSKQMFIMYATIVRI